MAPRLSTIKKLIKNAVKLIDAGKIARAVKILKSLDDKLSGSKARKPPNVYATFVQENYKKFSRQNPDKPASEILILMGKAWQARKKA